MHAQHSRLLKGVSTCCSLRSRHQVGVQHASDPACGHHATALQPERMRVLLQAVACSADSGRRAALRSFHTVRVQLRQRISQQQQWVQNLRGLGQNASLSAAATAGGSGGSSGAGGGGKGLGGGDDSGKGSSGEGGDDELLSRQQVHDFLTRACFLPAHLLQHSF